jgi:hypothetical protein
MGGDSVEEPSKNSSVARQHSPGSPSKHSKSYGLVDHTITKKKILQLLQAMKTSIKR